MNRIKTFDATGIAPDGILYAGDLNAIQDAAAALDDNTQTIKLNALTIQDNGLQLLKYGSGEARITGALRVDGILRGLAGLIAGAYTTTQRNAITLPPAGLVILNTTTNQYEWNKGTSGAPNWQPVGFLPANTSSITNADVDAAAAIAYSKLNLAGSLVNADVNAAAAIAYSKLNLVGLIVNADIKTTAAIARSKLDFGTGLVNADIAAAAAIAYTKLALTGSLVNADVATAAAIAYSKLNLAGSIINSDIASGAAIVASKFANYPADVRKQLNGDGTWSYPIVTINTQTGNYTLALTDSNAVVEMNVAGANSLTVPADATVNFPVGSVISVAQLGAGQTTVVAAGGVTLRSYNGNLKLAGQYGVASVIKRTANTWWVAGNLVP